MVYGFRIEIQARLNRALLSANGRLSALRWKPPATCGIIKMLTHSLLVNYRDIPARVHYEREISIPNEAAKCGIEKFEFIVS